MDYLQIITPSHELRLSDKQVVERNVTTLKQLSRDCDIPIMLVSSFNRENYTSPVSFSAFKETGAIEYGADVVLGLQLKAIHKANENKQTPQTEKNAILNEAKKANPREVELVILKNRNGIPWGKLDFSYHAPYNYFVYKDTVAETIPSLSPVVTPEDNIAKQGYVLIKNLDQLKEHIPLLQGTSIIGVDTETTGLNPLKDEVRLIQFAIEDKPTLLIDLFSLGEDGKNLIRDILQGDSVKVFHNSKFDLQMLKSIGVSVKGKIFDTMIANQLLFAGNKEHSHKLADVVKYFLQVELKKEKQTSDWSRNELEQEQLEYASKDVSILLPLYKRLQTELTKAELNDVATLEFQCVQAVANMELNGWAVDTNHLEEISKELTAVQEQLAPTLEAEFGADTNLNSPKQLKEALHAKGIAVKKTDKETLQPLAVEYPEINLLLEYKKNEKHITPFTKKWPTFIQKGRIHAGYHQLGADTGRFSSSNPNLQQVPKEKLFRSCFVAPEGCKLVWADYSQIELRVLAEITGDKQMIEAYKGGKDLHRLTASIVTKKDEVSPQERQLAKAINFGMIFGMGDKGLSDYAKSSYGVNMSPKEAKEFKKRFFEHYTGVYEWQKKQDTIRFSNNYETCTLSGRRRKWTKEPSSSALYNTPIQGTAADICKKALVLLNDRIDQDTIKLVGCVHDEIIVEAINDRVQEATEILQQAMEEAGKHYLKEVPVVAELAGVNSTWTGE